MDRIAVGTETTRVAVRITVKPGHPPWTGWRAFSSGITGRVDGHWMRMSGSSRSFQTQVAWRMNTMTRVLLDIGRMMRPDVRAVDHGGFEDRVGDAGEEVAHDEGRERQGHDRIGYEHYGPGVEEPDPGE